MLLMGEIGRLKKVPGATLALICLVLLGVTATPALICLVLLELADGLQAKPSLDNYVDATVSAVAKAVAAGADVNAADERYGTTPLMVLVWNESKIGAAKAEILLKAGADVNAKDSLGETALHRAAEFGSLDLVKTLLAAGADVNAVDNLGHTPLARASRIAPPLPAEEHVALLKLLLDSGADVRPGQPVIPGQPRMTPLLGAARASAPEVVQLLLEAGCPVDEGTEAGFTPLMSAAVKNSNPETVKVLLTAGADVTRRDDKGETALDKVRHNKSPAAAEIYSMLEAAVKKSAAQEE
ncbi:MAG: ankyrin repeat domain-containing protein [Candidatus Adiutrix sp.]|jgi:ankyrin repeat protein|nr:ankyrin repeat domain-containing protein [Candidatus Adiutrix sp.]